MRVWEWRQDLKPSRIKKQLQDFQLGQETHQVKGAPLCAYVFCDFFRSLMCDCDASA